jgi:hypothetical protein
MVFIAKGDNKDSTNKWLCRITNNIKQWTAFITMVDILFISFIGQVPRKGFESKESYDEMFHKACPLIYRNLNIIGLRALEDPFHPLSDDEAEKYVMIKFNTYVIYLVSSIYLHYHYTNAKRNSLLESQFKEIDYQRLFEFNSYKLSEEKEEEIEAKSTI